jgi:hypothetical protein
VKTVNILPGSKDNNKNNHIAACRVIIKVLFSFQQDFSSRVTVLHSEKVNWALPRPVLQEWVLDAFPDHTLLAGEGHRMFRTSLESWPGDFSGNQQPVATSPVGKYSPGSQPCRDTPQIYRSELTPESRAQMALQLMSEMQQVSGTSKPQGLSSPCPVQIHPPPDN